MAIIFIVINIILGIWVVYEWRVHLRQLRDAEAFRHHAIRQSLDIRKED